MATVEVRLLVTAMLVLLAGGCVWAQAPQAAGPAVGVTVHEKVLHRIDRRLFGQFMERPSWGEIGPEAAIVEGTNRLQPAARKLIEAMRIPIARFPGGTDVDYTDFRDMIDNVPGRSPARPITVGHQGHKVTNRFGYDEFLRLCEALKIAPILVVNLRRGLLGAGGAADGAVHAARLAAYCNAPADARLPAGLADWAKLRAANGRRQPYRVPYWQIGNESWAFVGKTDPDDYVRTVRAYVDALRAVDPTIRIIADGCPVRFAARLHKALGKQIDYYAVHHYQPWGMTEVRRGRRRVDVASLTPRDIWLAWATAPGVDADGQSTFDKGELRQARRLGYAVAMTEWNWNGWWKGEARAKARLDSVLAKGVGAAGMLHAIMRSGKTIALANQSMLIGKGWPIHAIHVDPMGKTPPYMMPSGQATMLYSQHHGPRRLAVDLADMPRYDQPYRVGGLGPARQAAYVDLLATRSDTTLFLHAINRHFDRPMRLRVDVLALTARPGPKAAHYVLEGRLTDAPAPGEPRAVARIRRADVAIGASPFHIDLPPRTVNVVEVPLAATPAGHPAPARSVPKPAKRALEG